MNTFYVYAYLRSKATQNGDTGSPYYIGKGRRHRAYSKWHGVRRPADERLIQFAAENLTEDDAFARESVLIAWYGRIDLGTGCLRNRTDGGDGSSGAVVSDATRQRLSKANSGRAAWNKGARLSEETKRRISDANRARSPETRKKLSDAGRRRVWSEETRRKIGAKSKGRTHTDEARRKMSASGKGRIPWNKGMCKSERNVGTDPR